jgi:hypothetical protein
MLRDCMQSAASMAASSASSRVRLMLIVPRNNVDVKEALQTAASLQDRSQQLHQHLDRAVHPARLADHPQPVTGLQHLPYLSEVHGPARAGLA